MAAGSDYTVVFSTNATETVQSAIQAFSRLPADVQQELAKLNDLKPGQNLFTSMIAGSREAAQLITGTLTGAISGLERDFQRLGATSRQALVQAQGGDFRGLQQLGRGGGLSGQVQGAFNRNAGGADRLIGQLQDFAKIIGDRNFSQNVGKLVSDFTNQRQRLVTEGRGIVEQGLRETRGLNVVQGATRIPASNFIGSIAPDRIGATTARPAQLGNIPQVQAIANFAKQLGLGPSPAAQQVRQGLTSGQANANLAGQFDALFARNLAESVKAVFEREVGRVSTTATGAALYTRGPRTQDDPQGVQGARFFRPYQDEYGGVTPITTPAIVQALRQQLENISTTSQTRAQLDAQKNTITAGLQAGTYAPVRQTATSEASNFVRELSTGRIFSKTGQELERGSLEYRNALQREAAAHDRVTKLADQQATVTRLANESAAGLAKRFLSNDKIIEDSQGVLYRETGKALNLPQAQAARFKEAQAQGQYQRQQEIGASLSAGTGDYVRIRQNATNLNSPYVREAQTGDIYASATGKQVLAGTARHADILQREADATTKANGAAQIRTDKLRIEGELSAGLARQFATAKNVIEDSQGRLFRPGGQALSGTEAQLARTRENEFRQRELTRNGFLAEIQAGTATQVAGNPNLVRRGAQGDLTAPVFDLQGRQLQGVALENANRNEVKALEAAAKAHDEEATAARLLAAVENGTAQRLKSNDRIISYQGNLYNERGQQLQGLTLQRQQEQERLAQERAASRSEGRPNNTVVGQGLLANFISGATGRGFGGARQVGNLSEISENLAASLGTTAKYTGLYSALGLIQQGIGQVIHESLDFIDSQTAVSIALGKSNEVGQDYIETLGKIARQSGSNVGESLDASLRGTYALTTPNESEGAKKAAGAATAEQAGVLRVIANKGSLQDATGDLLAVASAYNVTAENLDQIVDAVAGAKRSVGGDPNQISQGLANFAVPAQQAGYSINEAADIIALATSRLDESGNTVANRLSRVFAILGGSQGKNAIRTLNSGLQPDQKIDVNADVKTQIEQLAAVYPKLTTAQQQQIKQALGGTTAVREFDVVIQQHNRLLQAFGEQSQNAGLGQEEFNRRLADITGTIKLIQGDLKGLAVGLYQAGLFAPIGIFLKVLEPALNLLNQFLAAYNKLTDAVFGGSNAWKQLATAVGLALVAYKAFQSSSARGLGTRIEARLFPDRAVARRALAEGGSAAVGGSAAAAAGGGAAGSAVANRAVTPGQARIQAAQNRLNAAYAELTAATDRAAVLANKAATEQAAADKKLEAAKTKAALATGAAVAPARQGVLQAGAAAAVAKDNFVRAGRAGSIERSTAASEVVQSQRNLRQVENTERLRRNAESLAEREEASAKRAAARNESRATTQAREARRVGLRGVASDVASGATTPAQAVAARARVEATYNATIKAAADARLAAEAAATERLATVYAGRAVAEATGASRISFSQVRGSTSVKEAFFAAGRSIARGTVSVVTSLQELVTSIRLKSAEIAATPTGIPAGVPERGPGRFQRGRDRLNNLGPGGLATLAAGGAFVAYQAYTKNDEINKSVVAAQGAIDRSRNVNTDQAAVEQQITDLKETAAKARETSGGFTGTVVNALRSVFGGERTDNAAERAERQEAITQEYLDNLKKAQASYVTTGDYNGAIDLSSVDSVNNSFQQLQTSGASARDQLIAVNSALGELAEGAAGAKVRITGTRGAVVAAKSGKRIADQVALDQELLQQSGDTSPEALVDFIKNNKFTGGDLAGLTKLDANKVQSTSDDFINQYFAQNPGFDPTNKKQRDELRSQLKGILGATVQGWSDLSEATQDTYVNAAISQLTGALTPTPGQKADSNATIRAAVLAFVGPAADSFATSQVNNLSLGRAGNAKVDQGLVLQPLIEKTLNADRTRIADAKTAEDEARKRLEERKKETDVATGRGAAETRAGRARAQDVPDQTDLDNATKARKTAETALKNDQAAFDEIRGRDYSSLFNKGGAQAVAAQAKVDLLRAAKVAADRSTDKDLQSQIDDQLAAAEVENQNAKVTMYQAMADESKSFLALTDAVGRGLADTKSLEDQLKDPEIARNPFLKKQIEAKLRESRQNDAANITARDNARRTAGINPNDSLAAARNQTASDQADFDRIKKFEDAAIKAGRQTEYSADYYNAQGKVRQDKTNEVSASLEAARRERAITLDTGNATAAAAEELTAANEALAKYNEGDDQFKEALARRNQALRDVRDTQDDLNASIRAASFDSTGDASQQAQEDITQGLIAMAKYGQDDARYWAGVKQYNAGKRALADAAVQNASVAAQLGQDITNPLVNAQQATADAAAALAAAQNDPNATINDINKKRLDLQKAQNSEMQTNWDQQLDRIQSDYSLQRISGAQYIQYLKSLRKSITGTSYAADQERRKIDEAIKAANNSLQGAFNLGDIKVPSVYEIRRAQSADAAGRQYSDNSSVTININGIGSTAEIAEVVKNQLGTRAVIKRTPVNSRRA